MATRFYFEYRTNILFKYFLAQIVCFPGGKLDEVLKQINQTGYGLTLGIHNRIDETIQ